MSEPAEEGRDKWNVTSLLHTDSRKTIDRIPSDRRREGPLYGHDGGARMVAGLRWVRRGGGAVVAGICVCSAPLLAGAAPGPTGKPTQSDDLELPLAGLITNPDWSEKPDGDQLAQHYPPLGQMMGLGGRVRMQCEVTSQGALDACKILSETPRGLGFGAAALQLSTAFKMKPRTVDGAPISGGNVVIPIYFSPPVMDDEAATPPEPVGLDGKPPSADALVQARRLMEALKLRDGIAASVRHGTEQALEASAASGDGTSDPTVRAQALEALREAVEAAAPALVERQARSYAAHMSEAELAQAAAFMESPAGLAFASEQRRLATSADSGAFLWAALAKDARRRFCSQTTCAEGAPPTPPKR